MFKNLFVALTIAISSLFSANVFAEDTALAEEAKRILVQAAITIDQDPNAVDDALRFALDAEEKWERSGAKDARVEGALGDVTNALWASFYYRLAVRMNNTRQFANVGGVIDVMCEHAVKSPMTDDTILAMCVVPKQEE